MSLQRVARVGVRHLRFDGLGRPSRVIGIENQLRQLTLSSKPQPSVPAVATVSSLISQYSRSFATNSDTTKTTKRKSSKTTKKKPAPKKKALTEKQKEQKEKKKEAEHIKQLKETALVTPKKLPDRAYNLAFPQVYASIRPHEPSHKEAFAKTIVKLKEMPQYELEQYKTQAEANRAANEAAYEAWLKTFTPLQIKDANIARRALGRLRNKTRVHLLKDDRLVKRPMNAYMQFQIERRSGGDFMHLRIDETSSRISEEWKNMTEREREPYEQKARDDHARYVREHLEVYGEPSPLTTKPGSRT
ncbi:hypothetical protein N7468_000494 [Penicillium chermesinum]|uniref:HMG box domain-containing protein n=1 Tax=Penicillium chermesinum TaxID=63820 RepID=A0A9W9PKC4_9EURO|nr:uncharacterized protein N7468_000494 [Penicillium chermesinum]KAJ5249043.1 hypothetical protein N7468_000494 [Penicillium chermesinum]KAJ6151150.1 hypothetical protein N7470_007744 [Penicillium chermesinum]